MQALFRIVTVPALILVFTALYWLHIADAPSAARRVPLGVIVFILIMTVIVLLRDIRLERSRSATGQALEGPNMAEMFRQWVHDWRLQIIFTGLSIGYFIAFVTIGFNLANFLFLMVALPVAGTARGSRFVPAIIKTGLIAGIVSLVFFVLAILMDFNVPPGLLGF